MNQLKSLAWKEWNEAKTYLWIGIGVFLGLPLVNLLQDIYAHRRIELDTSVWIFFFGGTLAVFVAVGTTCRDFTSRLEDFWRSRPVGIGRWLAVKYLVGLAVVLIACVVPPLIQLAINRSDETALTFIFWFPFLWLAIFSAAFLMGCLIRKTAQAAMLAIGAMLLIYFLPIILPPLGWLNVSAATDYRITFRRAIHSIGLVQIKFAAGMLIVAAILSTTALIAVQRNWSVASGRRTMFGSASAALLLLLSTAAFQVGTNMPILQTIDAHEYEQPSPYPSYIHLPDEHIAAIQVWGNQGFAIATRYEWASRWHGTSTLLPFEISASGLRVGTPRTISARNYEWPGNGFLPGRPEIKYYLTGQWIKDDRVKQVSLHVINFTDGSEHSLTLYERPVFPSESQNEVEETQFYFYQDRLYIRNYDQITTIDISDPLAPQLISVIPFHNSRIHAGEGKLTEQLPQIPGLPPTQRLELALAEFPSSFDGTYLCIDWPNRDDIGRLHLYKLTELTDNSATFVLRDIYTPGLMDKVFASYSLTPVGMEHGMLYVGRPPADTLNSIISVFDLTAPHPLREIGHFGAPLLEKCCPLPDGRCIVGGGNKIWLIGPPPKHTN